MAEPIVRGRARRPPARTNKPTAGARVARPADDEAPPRGVRAGLERILLGVLTSLVSVNLWTGGPVLALWIGSKVQSAVGQLSMAAVGATLAVLIVETFVLYRALARLNARYNTLIGRVMPRQQAAWLKPMSGERRAIEVKRPLSATERIVVASVVVAVLAFEIWFFFFAHYSFAG